MEAALTPGDAFHVASLSTAKGQVRIGMMICYDWEFPESARALMLDGAEVILTPNACELNEDRIGQFRTRAFENMVAVAMTNYPAPHCNGHSCAFDGVAYLSDDTDRDHKIIEAGPEPGVVFADVDLDLLRQYRKNEVWGDAYRKPYAYGALVSGTASEPFRRRDSRRVRPAP
jgi:predicted amidohydrolase